MGLKKGDRAQVVRDNYAETDSRSFIGMTGKVVGVDKNAVVIRPDGESKSYGFAPEEVEPTR